MNTLSIKGQRIFVDYYFEAAITELTQYEAGSLCSVESKHHIQGDESYIANKMDDLAKKVTMEFPRLGAYKGHSHRETVNRVRAMAKCEHMRHVKLVIIKDGRLWADNTHWALSYMVRFGMDVLIHNIPHYFVDFRESDPLLTGIPYKITAEEIMSVIDNALRIQERVDRGWRPMNISLTLGDVFITGGFGG